jgi:hypothetical protein
LNAICAIPKEYGHDTLVKKYIAKRLSTINSKIGVYFLLYFPKTEKKANLATSESVVSLTFHAAKNCLLNSYAHSVSSMMFIWRKNGFVAQL